MALFAKKEKNVEENFIPQKIDFNKSGILGSFLISVLEAGDESDYEYLCKMAAKNFFKMNKNYLSVISTESNDDLTLNFELLNYFFETYKLGYFKASINEYEKEIVIYHYNSPFKSIHKHEYFLLEFYRLFFDNLLETKLEIKERKDNEKTVFTISV